MTDPFLFQVASLLNNLHHEKLDNLVIVLPNKRGSLFFKKHLANIYKKSIWLPEILSAEDFVYRIAELEPMDQINLNLNLYQSYKKVLGKEAESLDHFLSWAPIVLQDFNEIDRYLIPPENAFRNLKEIKEIEQWSLNKDEEELSKLQKKFLKFMFRLGEVYDDFTQLLLDKKQCYQGLAYRIAVGRIKESHFIENYQKFYFCGFNALNEAELTLFQTLINLGKAEILWDADKYYLNDEKQEAGHFLRRHFKKQWMPKNSFISDTLLSEEKKITIAGAPKNITQVAYAADIVRSWIQSGKNLSKCVIVLADENLLFPMLSALPKEVNAVNVTLEYPFQYSLLYEFIENWLQSGMHRSKGGSIYYKDFLRLTRSPYFDVLFSSFKLKNELVNIIHEKNLSYLSVNFIKDFLKDEYEFIAFLLEPKLEITDWIKSFQTLIHKLQLHSNSLQEEKAFVKEFEEMGNRLDMIQSEFPGLIDLSTFRHFIKQIALQSSVPFYGEPLQGLQIMGILESRTLDFENVILLSANENVLPAGKSFNSFLPNDLKKHLGLPDYQDKDAIYAYHFYRLIQRAKNCTFLYNTEPDVMGKGEKSRFLSQIVLELKEKNPLVSIDEFIIGSTAEGTNEAKEIRISKTPELINFILSKYASDNSNGLSSSSIKSYKKCSLRFYFNYVAGIKETEEVEEIMESGTFGEVIHHALELIYTPFVRKKLSVTDYNQLLLQVYEKVQESLLGKYSNAEIASGKNFLIASMMNKYVSQILKFDLNRLKEIEKNNTALEIVGLEEEMRTGLDLSHNGNTYSFVIRGIADRMELIGSDKLIIIDYKSSLKKDNDKFEFVNVEDLFINKQKDKAFQLFMYAWLAFKKGLTTGKKVETFIIPLRSDLGYFVGLSNKKDGFKFSDELFNQFENYLIAIIKEMLDAEIDFVQTQDKKECEFCVYADICNR